VIRKTIHALAVLAIVAIASLVWAQPAQAAPSGPCSIEEWRNPASFVDCTHRMAAAAGLKAGCVTAPSVGSPTDGLAGWVTTRPDSSLRDGVVGRYSQYGVGGYGLDTYDLGCLGTLKHPNMAAANGFASGEFQVAASVLGAANGMRERAYDPNTMWGWSDSFLESSTTTIFKYIFTPIGMITLAVIGVGLVWHARSGNMSQTMRVTTWALFIMVAVTGLAKYPVGAAHAADTAVTKGLSGVHSILGPGPKNIPADQCALGGDSCTDHRTVAVRASDTAVEALLYRSWVSAVLGSPDTDTAKKYGPALYDATTMTWGEAARVKNNATLRQQLLDQKANTFNAIAEQIRTEDPVAYENLQGTHSASRVGAGFVAAFSSLVFSAFDMLASAVILFGFLVFRAAIILLPLLGTFGMALPASGPVRRVLNATVAGVANIFIFGAAAGIYLSLVDWIFRSPLPGLMQTIAVLLLGIILFVLMRPERQMLHTATGRSRGKPTLASRLIAGGKQIHAANASSAASTSSAADDGAGGSGGAPRPENTPSRARVNSRIITAAVAPSVSEAAGNPAVSAVLGAISSEAGRPEGSTKASKVRAVAGLAATATATATGGPLAGAAAHAAIAPRPEAGATPRPTPAPAAPRPAPAPARPAVGAAAHTPAAPRPQRAETRS
jgi:hypothetical protein